METFTKTERLSNRKVIDDLFTNGMKFRVPGFLVLWSHLPANEHPPLQVLISVSKKKFKLATRRNYLKRLIREGFRMNKQALTDVLTREHGACAIALVYSGPEKPEPTEITAKIILILRRLQGEYEKAAG
jgi:ribonuclease P protein component